MKILLICIAIHFVADFLLQSREMGQKKSSEPAWLFYHLGIQYFMFTSGLMFFVGPILAVKFALFNTLIHGIIDWNIWRLYKVSAYLRIQNIVAKKHGIWTQPPEEDVNIKAETAAWKYWEDHWFYTTIGLDQALHMATIVALLGWLI